MQNALTFIIKTLLELYIITFVLRFILQWVRAGYRNPITQFFVRLTNPLVIPARRLIPSIGGLDAATIVIVVLLELAVTIVLVNLTCMGEPYFIQIIGLTLLRIVYMTLRIYLFILFVYVVMSWIGPGTSNPAASLLTSIAEPVLKPFRRVIPPIAGFDLSVLFVLIAIQALTMLLPIGRVAAGMGCLSITQLL
ncbi:MAG: YggT family protein [Gammaproteobacteria bacterium]|jgi:YggT family protein|nr:YggT family protein [Gammaproteobacteria bacterium]